MIAATNNQHKGKAAVNAIDLKRLFEKKNDPPDPLLNLLQNGEIIQLHPVVGVLAPESGEDPHRRHGA